MENAAHNEIVVKIAIASLLQRLLGQLPCQVRFSFIVSNISRLPCSPKNLYQKDKSSRALSKWYQICSVLSVPIHHSKELQDAIHTINDDINDFDTLHYVINEALSEEQAT